MKKYGYEYRLSNMTAYYSGKGEISLYTDDLEEAEQSIRRYIKNTMETVGLVLDVFNVKKYN